MKKYLLIYCLFFLSLARANAYVQILSSPNYPAKGISTYTSSASVQQINVKFMMDVSVANMSHHSISTLQTVTDIMGTTKVVTYVGTNFSYVGPSTSASTPYLYEVLITLPANFKGAFTTNVDNSNDPTIQQAEIYVGLNDYSKVSSVSTSIGTFTIFGTSTTTYTQNSPTNLSETQNINYNVTLPTASANMPGTFSITTHTYAGKIQSINPSSGAVTFTAAAPGSSVTPSIVITSMDGTSTTTYSCTYLTSFTPDPVTNDPNNANLATITTPIGSFTPTFTSPTFTVTNYVTTSYTNVTTHTLYVYLPYTTTYPVAVPVVNRTKVSTLSTIYYYGTTVGIFPLTPNTTIQSFTAAGQTKLVRIVCVAQNTSKQVTYNINFKIAPMPKPAVPANLTASASASAASVSLSWQDVDFESGYKIYRNGTYIALKGANITTHTDVGVSFENTYTYTVTAYNTAGTSANSNEAIVTTINNPTAAPTNLTGNTITTNPLHVDLTWTDNANNETKYRIFRNNVQLVELDANTTSYTDNSVFWNTTYSYQVKAWNTTNGYSNPSNTLSVIIGDNPTGISIINNTIIKLYPNPTSNQLSIQSEEIIKEVLIYNSQGKLVKTETKSTFDVSDLAKGIYFVNINNAQQKISFIKE